MASSANDYIALIPSENRSAPNFVALLTAFVQAFVDAINQFQGFVADLDLDQAVGAQLDVIGLWVGLPRKVAIPITGPFFSFDTVGLGFDQGVWQSINNPNGFQTLDDPTYRTMLYAKIGFNFWDGSLAGANKILAAVFPGGQVFLKDNFNMTESLVTNGSILSGLFSSIVSTGYIPLRPAAVALV